MKKQSGFTLIELAIVLVIIGLLLGGVLKGQELINSAKVKNMAGDFKNIQVYIYGYQDRFRALPGDDNRVNAHVGGTPATTGGTLQNGLIEGAWDGGAAGVAPTTEAGLFWQHVRLADFAPGPTQLNAQEYYPTNADGGRIGVQSIQAGGGAAGFATITGPNLPMPGSFVICSGSILGRIATQLDVALDDGETSTGSVRAILQGTTGNALTTAAINAAAGATYTVCMSF